MALAEIRDSDFKRLNDVADVLDDITASRHPRQSLMGMMSSLMHGKADLDPEEVYGPPPDKTFWPIAPGAEEHEYLPAPDLGRIGVGLIASCKEFDHLSRMQIIYLWKRKGGDSGGMLTLGKCQKAGGLARHFSGATWFVWLAADHLTTLGFTRLQVEALLHHELLHAGTEETPNGELKPVSVAHDWEGFSQNVRRYGAWNEGLMLARGAWKQLPLEME